MQNFLEEVERRVQELHTEGAETISDYLNLKLADCKPEIGEYTLHCHTKRWMCNTFGTIHGGMCATILDQSMGCVAFVVKPDKCPTVEMNVMYHRPVMPEEDTVIVVKIRSLGRQLIHLSSELYMQSKPDKLCVSATAVYFYKGESK